MWVVVITIIRLAAKYERSSRDYSSVYGMYLGLPPQVTRRRRCAFKQMVNDAEREVLGIWNYDLHWPTPMPFAHRLLGSGTEETTLAHTVEIILIIASVNDCFEQFPVHAIAAASYNLGCKLLGMVQQNGASSSPQWASGFGFNAQRVTRQIGSVLRQELLNPFPWLIPGVAAFRIRWAKILLACPANGDWDHCKYKLEASNRSCRNHIGKKRLRTWSRLIQSFLHDDHKTVERFWEDVPPFLLCRRHHYEQSEKIHALWLKGLEAFHVHVAHDVFVEDQYQPPTPISLLPSQIHFSILANLDEAADWYRCMLVSRKWAETAVRLLWKQIECSDPRDYDAICQALSCGSPFFTYQDFIRKLTLTALSTKLDDKSILPLGGCTRLEFLSLSPCPNLTDAGLMPLVGKNPQLEYLYICHSGHITRQSMNAVANTCKALKGLALIGCNNISNESMIGLFGKCSFITMLALNECTQVREDAVNAFLRSRPVIHKRIIDEAFVELPGSLECKYLARLNLDSCENLGDAAMKKIVKVAPNLRLLYLGNCRNLTNDAVHAICKLGRNLLSIDLSRCSQITDVAIKELAQDCSDIREIYLRGSTQLTDESVTCLAALQELRTIILDDCHITCKSILALAGCNSFEDLPKHRERSLQWVSLNGCDRVTLQSIAWLLKSAPGLFKLELRGVPGLDECDFEDELTQEPEDVGIFYGKTLSQLQDYVCNSPQIVAAMRRLELD
ncbi:ubiquitin ligase complex F-box protein GRR1, partial [Metarhizium majus ARSEF 297]